MTNEQRLAALKQANSLLFDVSQSFMAESKKPIPDIGLGRGYHCETAAQACYRARIELGWAEDRVLKDLGIREDK